MFHNNIPTTNQNRGNGHGERYHGYQPISASDFESQQEKQRQFLQNAGSPTAEKSLKFIVAAVVFSFSFLLLFIWQVLIPTCRISALCELSDLSSHLNSNNLFHTFTFRILSSLIWLGLTFGSFMIVICSVVMYKLAYKPIGPSLLVKIASIIKYSASKLLLYQYITVGLPNIAFFIIIGTTISWSTAGAFTTGAMACMLPCQVAKAFCSRGNLRMSTATIRNSFSDSLNIASQTAAIMHLTTICIAVLSSSAAYLMHADITALTGFLAGSSLAALFMRVSSTFMLDATITGFSFTPPFRAVLPPNVVAVVSSGISIVNGIVCDVFDSNVICIVATAIIGSSLPFFYRNQFALCVFNHLSIDKSCGPFGYPQILSYTTYICNFDSLFLDYPLLDTWSSTSLFVAAPFVLGASNLLVYSICWLRIRFRVRIDALQAEENNEALVVKSFIGTMRRVTMMAMILLIVTSLGVCFGLFGPNSSFQKSDGFGSENNLRRMALDGTTGQCATRSTTGVTKHTGIPSGASYIHGKYRPVTVSGFDLGSSGTTAVRLFVCNVLGIFLGVVVFILSTASRFRQTQISNELGIFANATRRFAVNLLVQLPITLMMAAVLGSSYKLYGAYGIGFAAIGYLSSTGASSLMSLLSTVMENSRNMTLVVNCSPEVGGRTNSAFHIIRMSRRSSQMVNNGSMLFCGVLGVFCVVQQSGLLASPRDMVGRGNPPPVLISSIPVVGVTDILVFVGLLFGAVLPVLCSALFMMSVQRMALVTFVQRRKVGERGLRFSPRLVKCLVKIGLQEMGPLIIVAVLGGLVVGFGFGQRALVGMLTVTVIISYLIGTLLIDGSIGQKAKAANGTDKRVMGVKHGIGPTLQVVTKVTMTMALLMTVLMQQDHTRGWVGIIVLAILIGAVALLSVLNHRRYLSVIEEASIHDSPKEWANLQVKVSPFYEEGSTLNAKRVRPDSEFADSMRMFGRPQGDISPTHIQSQDVTGFANENTHLVVPRQTMPMAEGVLRDEVGRK